MSPALEIDGLEADMLTDSDIARQFRILVTTPEKLDLLLRGGWEKRIGRPLTLVVVDEAHGLGSKERGLRLELLLATINRESRDSQFLLLTPFIRNTEEVARWLSPDSAQPIDLALDWVPNDRMIGIASPVKGDKRGAFSVQITTKVTSNPTLTLPESLSVGEDRPLKFTWSDVSTHKGKLAAATAQILQRRGTVIVLVDSPLRSWTIADWFKIEANKQASDEDRAHIQRFMADEMGADYPLSDLLNYGVAVHHGGLSDDVRALVEWLTENRRLRVLVATTTIAHGVNFPVSGVVFASHQYALNRSPWHEDMPPQDFWNIAGRAGRVDQGDLGVVALVAPDAESAARIETFIKRSVSDLNSTLVEMVQRAAEQGKLLNLHTLASEPGWSSFLQFLAHTYRQIGNHEQFASEVEQVLRGTMGFQRLRKSHKGWADNLVQGVYRYAERLKGKPLSFVDATGFSWESVSLTLAKLSDTGLSADVWSPELFSTRRHDLAKLMGILLDVPELRSLLGVVTGGDSRGDVLARIVSDWVMGRPLTEMAQEYFSEDDNENTRSAVDAMTYCCQRIFGRLTQTASWGLSALQSLTVGDTLESMSAEQQQTLKNLPSRVYYGVNSDAAVALRLLGVPRMAAPSMASIINVAPLEPLHQVRKRLREAGVATWESALGERGKSYHRVWSIMEGQV